PGVKGWINGGLPAWAGARAQRLWLAELEKVISPQLQSHGGPVAFVEGVSWAEPAPASVTTISANDPGAPARSRPALTAPARAHDFTGKRVIQLPPLEVAPGDALWLPVEMPLAAGGLCGECSAFAKGESIVYATAELQAVEFENGILAMEFAAPRPGEVMLQL